MKNIYDILKDFGVEIPEDKKEDFKKELHENYKTIAEYNGLTKKVDTLTGERDTYKNKYEEDIKSRDNDLSELKKQLEEAGAEGVKVEELTQQLATLQKTYDEAQTEYDKQLAKQRYEFAVKEQVNELKFTSNSAKRAFLNDALAKGLPMENDTILGFQDYVNEYKKQDEGAFVVEKEENDDEPPKTPKFSGSSKTVDTKDDTPAEDKPTPLIW